MIISGRDRARAMTLRWKLAGMLQVQTIGFGGWSQEEEERDGREGPGNRDRACEKRSP